MRQVPGVPVLQPDETHEDALAAAADSIEKASPEAGQVLVYPGGASFPTITAALDSITNASATNPYDVIAGAGTYEERITLKEYVNLEGAGSGQTIIQSAPTSVQDSGVVVAASHSSLSGLTVSCPGGSWGDWGTAVLCNGANPFTLAECTLVSDDQNNAGINLVTLQVDVVSSAASTLEIIACDLQATAQNHQSVATVVSSWNNARLGVQPSTKIVATGGTQSFGLIAPMSGSVALNYAYVEGATYSIYKPYAGGSVVADHCQLVGPVSSGVTVINGST